MTTANGTLGREIDRRRTFAIISHPDAGKTTLTEKFLLYAGCIDIAGAVRGRKTRRAVTSDFMELERERGISISSTVLSFTYREHIINLLDTPGHQDFSEDTYRTLAAADSAVMVIDAAKGIETQTRKLFQVCAARRIPILTFINKMDRQGKDPLDLLSEIEQVLGIAAVPRNWPVGSGPEFRGVHNLANGQIDLFEPSQRGSVQASSQPIPAADLAKRLPDWVVSRYREEIELVEGAGYAFDPAAFRQGRMTPVFFGSAMTNFGVERFLEEFLELAPPPGARGSDRGPIPPDRDEFAGIVFKIQANLNPKHRDRVAFVRVCSGRFTPEVQPFVARTGDRVRSKGSHKLFAREREQVEEAFPGDIIGLAITGGLRLGDTLYEKQVLHFEGLPQFSPERFAAIRCVDTARRKQMTEGLEQLADEGAIQVFHDPSDPRAAILAAIGELQFDVVRFRLESEYSAQTEIEVLPYNAAAWVKGDASSMRMGGGVRRVLDHRRRTAILATDAWSLRYLASLNPTLVFRAFSEELFVPSE